jgi:hypothetical protein
VKWAAQPELHRAVPEVTNPARNWFGDA